MPQLDTTYFVSQIFWLGILFTLFYLSVRYLIMPRIESIIKARILVKEDTDRIKEELLIEIEQIKQDHKVRADEVRNLVKEMQEKSNKKFQDFSAKLESDLKHKLEKKLSESEANIDKFTKDFHQSKDSVDLITHAASKILDEVASIKVDKSKLKKYAEV